MGSSSPVSAPSPVCGRGFEGDVAVGDPPPTLSLPLKGGGDAHKYPLPLEGGGLGWGWGLAHHACFASRARNARPRRAGAGRVDPFVRRPVRARARGPLPDCRGQPARARSGAVLHGRPRGRATRDARRGRGGDRAPPRPRDRGRVLGARDGAAPAFARRPRARPQAAGELRRDPERGAVGRRRARPSGARARPRRRHGGAACRRRARAARFASRRHPLPAGRGDDGGGALGGRDHPPRRARQSRDAARTRRAGHGRARNSGACGARPRRVRRGPRRAALALDPAVRPSGARARRAGRAPHGARLWTCGAWFTVDAVEALARARQVLATDRR